MAGPNRYLDGVDAKAQPRNQARKTLVLWIVLIVMFVAVYNFLHDPNAPPPRPRVPTTTESTDLGALIPRFGPAVLLVAISLLLLRRTRRAASDFVVVDLEISEGKLDAAVDRMRAQLQKQPHQAANVYFNLALCAERRGDFREADELYGLARERWAPKGKPAMGTAHYVARLDARRAFVLVAADRLNEAAVILNELPSLDAHPDAHAHRVRAEALLLSKRGDRDGVIALLDRERSLVENGLAISDRLLLEVLYNAASGATGSRVRLDPEERRVIALAAPAAVAVLEAA